MSLLQPKICFIGLKGKGWPLAALIAKAGYPIVVSDNDRSLIDSFCSQTGASALEPVGDLSSIETVMVALCDSKDTAAMLVGTYGLARLLRPGTCVINVQRSGGCHALSAALAQYSLDYLGAELTGDLAQAGADPLDVVVTGVETAMQRRSALFEVIGSARYVGPLVSDGRIEVRDAAH
ncbi:NAD(P)-dependent oxidoreductase [Pseudomonas sp. USTB-Z]|uniref:NAD(P)-binding domain-containing protein n=1 Tax=Pseudomonas TaxID=286 RepID=UPI0018A911AA|nr:MULTISPECIES: NAD(P)-binding domain-containing protein [Pseudomonas]MBF8789647.1 NAD(P)-dependent oxidoreductase [Pseudomonas asiatica]MBX6689194.1 NAD(P)-dependent oxidoreductase [Pseudomonas sp. USTB-Z]